MSTQTIKTRICMISDTHKFHPNPPQQTSVAYRHPLPKADILLHAGDLTMVGCKHEHEAVLSMLKDADAELKIVIPGNHDITLDEEYYTRFGHLRHRHRTAHTTASIPTQGGGSGHAEDPKEIKALYTSAEARSAGIRYMEEGLQTFTLSNGAEFTVYASAYQPEFCQWAFAYDRSIDRFNPPSPSPPPVAASSSPASLSPLSFTPPHPVPDFPAVDIMITHGPPFGILDRVVPSGDFVGCEHLLRAVTRARPRLHVFGHIHEGYGARRMNWATSDTVPILCDPETVLQERGAYVDVSGEAAEPLRVGEETLFVNASVVTVRYKPVNAPWVVDLDLPAEQL